MKFKFFTIKILSFLISIVMLLSVLCISVSATNSYDAPDESVDPVINYTISNEDFSVNTNMYIKFTPSESGTFIFKSIGINADNDPSAVLYKETSSTKMEFLAKSSNISSNDKNFTLGYGFTSGVTYYILIIDSAFSDYSLTITTEKSIIMSKDSSGTWGTYDEDGTALTNYNGLATNDYGIWYITDGILDRVNGLIKVPGTSVILPNTWVYLSDGKFGENYTGMAKNQYGWWYLRNSLIDNFYTGLAQNDYGKWYIVNGALNQSTTGLVKMPSTSKIWRNTWVYLQNGKFTEKYIGMAKNQYGWYYVNNSVVDLSYTGMAKNQYGWWYMKKGKLDKTYTGMAKNQYGWWYMKNGQLDRTYTGMAKNDYGWWHMTKGKLDRTYTGIDKNEWGSWYMKNGQLQKNFTGKVKISGKTYNIKNGKVV